MSRRRAPAIGSWYRQLDAGGIFQVVALDKRARTVEIQTFDGELQEIDLCDWFSLPLRLAPAPPDASGAFDLPDSKMEDEDESVDGYTNCSEDHVEKMLSSAALRRWQTQNDK